MEFAAGATIAEPGVSCARLFCPVMLLLIIINGESETSQLPIEGAYLVNKAEARIGDHLLLQWSFVPRNKRQHSSTSPETPVSRLVKLPADSQAVKVEIQQPLNGELHFYFLDDRFYELQQWKSPDRPNYRYLCHRDAMTCHEHFSKSHLRM